MATPIAPYLPTGIHVVIVGAGFGGLTASIEARLKGHTVSVLERAPKWEQLGDIISISQNAGRVLSRWDPAWISDKLRKICMNHKSFIIHTHKGEFVFEQPIVTPDPERPTYNGHRAEIHRVLFDYAEHLGVRFHMGKRVTAYKEDPKLGKAWVECDDGETFVGDVVVGADGVRSRARKLALGLDDRVKSTGYAVYRAWFNAEEHGILDDSLTREFAERGDTHTGWLGPDVHLLVATCKGGRELSWVCTHKDGGDIDESWSYPGRVEDVLKLLEGWDPRCRAIVAKTPSLVDWKLVHREPLPTWISPGGHICLIGDAAHPFLPTSIQGCSQAIEDGVALATILSLTHTEKQVPDAQKIPSALKIYERLRYDRVKSAQKKGEEVRDMWHKADWEKVRLNPGSIKMPREDWLLKHDCETFVRRMYRRALAEFDGGDKIAITSLAANRESDEFLIEMPPTPVATPKCEVEDPMNGFR
ncbi:unnamed protein product [Tuber melanosporum]|uniref:(Perigord truffle) hypothetical protein n=1 Tax=Tuber melanosporum (strain Mel28) TaxID=656061 RepID=D5GQ78_TUBMM|nr:uncharacterized protein GSTUM_00012239001 [Tuber melanosporum]CAZ86671.1 unnamed protein product [Tuber melanosporum]